MDLKVRYEIEFPINSSPQLLYQYISTPSGLSEWFADNVNSRGEFLRSYGMILRKRKTPQRNQAKKIKFKWVDAENKDTQYFF
jgi:hypothetical protein